MTAEDWLAVSALLAPIVVVLVVTELIARHRRRRPDPDLGPVSPEHLARLRGEHWSTRR